MPDSTHNRLLSSNYGDEPDELLIQQSNGMLSSRGLLTKRSYESQRMHSNEHDNDAILRSFTEEHHIRMSVINMDESRFNSK